MRPPGEGDHFGRYRLVRRLGAGGMGVVYAAHDETLGRDVALKLVTPHLAGDEDFRARFEHEAAVLARLDSPRIVKIYDHGEHDGALYLVTQLIAGGDLSALVRREGALPPALASAVLTQVVEGLVDAHAVGVVHRDIKPANVLLRERGRELEAFLCDFGIATTLGADLSRTGTVAGSLPYMAPERHRGEPAGPQGDVYSAGCLLWHALTGAAPYAGTDVEVAMAHINAALPELPGRDPYSLKANAVIAKAMAKDPRKRYPTARAMLTDLTQLAALAPDAIALPGATAVRQQLVIPPRRRRWVPALVAAGAVLGVVSATLAVALARDDAPTERTDGTRPPATALTASRRPVVETPTLDPRPVLVTENGVVRTTVPDVVGTEGALPGAGLPGAPLPGGGTAPASAGASSKPAAAPGSSPAAPTYRYQCWDGSLENELSRCGWPTGATGMDWVFSNFDVIGCSRTQSATSAQLEAYSCTYTFEGTKVDIQIAKWTSASAALSWYRQRIVRGLTEQGWSVGGAPAGTDLYGEAGTTSAPVYRRMFVYSTSPSYGFYISAPTSRTREAGRHVADGDSRPRAWLQGVER